jgi:NADH-quinone oxidoreductase subunit N
MALALAIFMFSMAGIPPLGGFLAKFFVFQAAIQSELYTLAVIGVVTSVIAAYYYVRIVKLMYFDDPVDSFDRPGGWAMNGIIGATGLITLLFLLMMNPVLNSARAAAASLFAG